MYGIIQVLHVIICVLLVVVVLMQQSRGGGMSSVFGGGGGGSAESLFGGKGATPFFIRLTTGLAIGFFFTSVMLVLISRRSLPESAIDRGLRDMQTEPVMPGTGEPGPVIPEEPAGGGE
jgi:preprotein translocase subunit SecG